MEYSINELAKLSGVSTRTLRYYNQIGLLNPARNSSNEYRIYGQQEVDRLQEILFFRELGVGLEEIKVLLTAPGYDRKQTLKNHLHELKQKRDRIDLLINNVSKTMNTIEGAIEMTDKEKFEGFGQKLVDENEKKYGDEIRSKYGDKTVDEANQKIKGMTKAQYEKSEKLRMEFEMVLEKAFNTSNPTGELAQKACELHKQWLCVFYPNYSKEYHNGLAEMYVADERFRANFDKIALGCTEFLRDAIKAYCS